MDRALDKASGRTVDAEDLWLLDRVDREGYECFGCGVPMLPCAYEPGMKVRPYFSAREKPHRLDCKANGEIALLLRAKVQSLATERDSFPGLMPQRLVLQKTRPLSDRAGEEAFVQNPAIGQRRPFAATGEGEAMQHPKTAGTIRSICRAFLRYPHDRNQPLSLPDIYGTTYDSVFWRLKSSKIIGYPRPHLFYAPLSWRRLRPTGSHLDVALGVGEWTKAEGDARTHLTRPYRVRLLWEGWSARSRNALLKEIEVARSDHMKSSKGGKNEKGWLFFVGQQDAADEAIFIVDDHRLVCCFCAELTYPEPAGKTKRP